jgi:hypothetical protein
MTKIGVIVCSNGLGHLRRVISICAFMLKHGFDGHFDLYLNKSHLKRLLNWTECNYVLDHPYVNIIDFVYPKSVNGRNKLLIQKKWGVISLPNLNKYDIVWSDNIIDVLYQRSDAIITGSFLWHEVLEKSKGGAGLEAFVNSQRKLLEKHNPIMVGNELFATPEVRSATQFIPVGFYRYDTNLSDKIIYNILYASGLGGEEETKFRSDLDKIIKQNIKPPAKLFVEPRLLPAVYPEWIKKSDFSGKMFQSCMAVCIRPGFGTVSDSVVAGNKIFSYSSESSFEMIHNSNVLSKMKLGVSFKSPLVAYKKAIDYLNNKKELKKYLIRAAHIRTDGVYATANIILKNGYQ